MTDYIILGQKHFLDVIYEILLRPCTVDMLKCNESKPGGKAVVSYVCTHMLINT